LAMTLMMLRKTLVMEAIMDFNGKGEARKNNSRES